MPFSDLTVIVPNYNHAKYLPECLDAILSQSVQPLEIIIMDDASQDNSREIIHSYALRYPIIRHFENSENLGVVATVNRAIQYSKGEFLAFCAADDMVLPEFFKSCVGLLKLHPQAGLCCSDPSEFIDQKPYKFSSLPILKSCEFQVFEPSQLANLLATTGFWVPSYSTIYRKSCVLKHGLFNPRLRHLCDWYLNYQIAFHHSIVYVPSSLGASRVLQTSYARSMKKNAIERNRSFEELFLCLERDGLLSIFLKTGLLGQLGVHMVVYLFLKPKYWKFFPRSLGKKMRFFVERHTNLRKWLCAIFKRGS